MGLLFSKPALGLGPSVLVMLRLVRCTQTVVHYLCHGHVSPPR